MSGATNGAGPSRGLPILSGPPPVTESSACRQCGKDFNPIWRRSHPCGHCGYEYCSTCLSDGQALMPRKPGESSSSGSASGVSGAFSAIKEELGIGPERRIGSGYEVESVCLYCLSMLQVTAAPAASLRSLPIKRLKDYLAAYNLPCLSPSEKEDFVQAVMKARNLATGCLSPEAESYYRRKSVPRLGQPPKAQPTSSVPARQAPARQPPPSSPAQQPRPSAAYRPPSQARSPHPQARPPQNRPPPPHQHYHPQPQPQPQYRPQSAPTQPRAQVRPSPRAPPARQPSPPVPTILSLVSLPKSYLSTLSIGTLKAILYENHVRVDFKQVLEKEELVNRVSELIVDERKRLERQRLEEEREAGGSGFEANGPAGRTDGAALNGATEGDLSGKKVPTGPMPEVERGLCVVCQDEEATLAVVDCGHLAMCAHCSDLIMATSQECPLCRTRIVTPQRLIRIYRV